MPHVVRAARGTALSCKGWIQEAALRMLQNNLDPEVAERPDDLVVYGGTGKAARDWKSFDAITRELLRLGEDETLLVQSGKPVGVLRTHDWAPRVLIANSNLVGDWASWPEFLRRGVEADIVTDQTAAHDPLSYLPLGVALEDWDDYAAKKPDEFTERARDSIAKHVEAMVGFLDAGAEVFDYGNSLRGEAKSGGFERAFAFPGFVPAYIRPLFCEGKGPFRWAALSGDPRDIAVTDDAVLELFGENDH